VRIASLPVIQPETTHRSAALLAHLVSRMRLRVESVLAPFGLRQRHLVALTVLRDGGGSTQQALSTTLQIDSTNLVGLLNELEAEKLIERRRSDEDRRRHIVELTTAGAKRLAQAELALATVEDDVLGALDDEQRDTLYRLLQQATSGDVVECSPAVDA
jgi:DNA-binding MarR family transcriptional regulator